MNSIAIGRLLRANTSMCVIGCKVTQTDSPAFGDMLRIPLLDGSQIYGLVYDIHVDDDGLVRQLVSAAEVSEEVIEDNRQNRNVPIEMSVAFIGWERENLISQTRVPRPPLSLDAIFRCSDAEMIRFLQRGAFGYLRTLLRNPELPAADLIAAHLRQVIHFQGGEDMRLWVEASLNEVIAQLKSDYPQLMDVLSAVSAVL